MKRHPSRPDADRRIAELEARLEEAEETLRAIRSGEVDAIVVSGPKGERVFTLKGAERPYRRLVETMSEGAATLAKSGTVLYCNIRFAEMLGLPLEQVMGRGMRDHVPKEQLDTFDTLFRSGWEGTSKGEIALRRADGALLTVHLSLSALEEDEPVLCLVATDLTEQIRAQELRKSEERAVSRASEFEALLNAVPAAVFIARDREATRIDGNSVCYELLRLPKGAEVSSSAPLPPGNFRIFKEGVELPADKLPVHVAAAQGVEVRSSEFSLVFDDGSVRRLLGNATPLFDEQGNPNGAVGAFIDITERVRAEEALREADRRKNHFLGVLSHELRNPLGPIGNALYLLDHAAPGGEQAARARAVLGRQVDHLTRLVDDLLDVTRISRGKIQLQRTRFDLGELALRTIEDHKLLLAEREIGLDVSIAPGPLPVDADATRVAQVLSNLLQNSAKFTGHDGRISVLVERDGDEGLVRVQDTGIGIAPEMLGRIFEPFTQIDDSLHRSRGGLGLGLALVKGLIELHGGNVEARSDGIGRGAEFIVRLRLASAHREAPPPTTEPAPVRPRKILVIEDNPDAAETLREVLAMGEHQVEIAYDGRQGIEKARASRPDIILCDVGLPEMDGYAVARQIRSDETFTSTVLVAITGYALPDDQRRAAEAGFDRHLAKPASVSQILEVLSTARTGNAQER